jgi:hypothetical protein
VNATGFASLVQDFEVASTVPVIVNPSLKLGAASSTVTVEGGEDLVENDPTFHTDIDRNLIEKLPVESQSSSLSSIVTLVSPGVAADSNGLFHGLGDHASNSFSIDSQSITDQQSKVFSNQLPSNAVQSKSSLERPPPNTAARPAWSSLPPPVRDRALQRPPAASTPPTEASGRQRGDST